VPLRFSVIVLAVIGAERAVKSRSLSAVPERVRQLDRIWP
jgi:hypothetical protein